MARRRKGAYRPGYYDSSYEQAARQRIVNSQTGGTQSGQNGWQGSYVGASYPQEDVNKYSRVNPAYSTYAKKKRGMSKGKKVALGALAAVMVVLLSVGSAAALYVKSVNEELTQGGKTEEEILNIQDAIATETPTNFDEPFYMLLIGSDKREDGSVAGARSDTNIAVRIDPVKNVITMVSIPRDTQVDLDEYGINKFNAAYTYDGAAGAIREAEELLDIDISHYAEVDFESLSELVDAVGGVDIEVEEPVDDPHLPGIYIEAGEQHLDGEQALAYARTRQYVDGDFTRTSHQRELVTCLARQVLELPVTDLPRVISAAAKCVTTDLSMDQLLDLAQQFQGSFDDLTFYSAMVPSTTGMEDGVSYVYTREDLLPEFMKLVEAGEDPNTLDEEAVASEFAETSGNSYAGDGSYAYDNSYAYNDSYTYDNSYAYDGSYAGSSGTDAYGTDTYGSGANGAYVDSSQAPSEEPASYDDSVYYDDSGSAGAYGGSY